MAEHRRLTADRTRAWTGYGEAVMVMVKVAVAVFRVAGWPLDRVVLVSSTSRVKVVEALLLVGVPEITPVAPSSVRPRGGLADPLASFHV